MMRLCQPLAIGVRLEVEHAEEDGVGEVGIGLRRGAVVLDGQPQEALRLEIVLPRRAIHVSGADVEEIPGVVARRRLPARLRSLHAADQWFKARDDQARDLVLKVEQPLFGPVEEISPDQLSCRGPDEVNGHAQAPFREPRTAFHDIVGTQGPTRFAHIPRRPLEPEARVPRHHREGAMARQQRDDVFGDGIRQMRPRHLGAEIDERKDGDDGTLGR